MAEREFRAEATDRATVETWGGAAHPAEQCRLGGIQVFTTKHGYK
jgi:hypothetical protein